MSTQLLYCSPTVELVTITLQAKPVGAAVLIRIAGSASMLWKCGSLVLTC